MGFKVGFYLKVLLFSGFKPQAKMTWIPCVLPSKTASGIINLQQTCNNYTYTLSILQRLGNIYVDDSDAHLIWIF